MSLSSNKIPLAGANAVTGTAGAYLQPATVTTGAGTAVTIPAGLWQMPVTTIVVVQMNTSNNASSLTWVNIAPVNTAVFIMSDGVNFQANSPNSAAITVTLYGPNGGTSVTQSAFATS